MAHLTPGLWPLLPILVLAAVLRLWQLGESLWLDELHTAWVVSGPISDIAERARIGNQSPLWFFLPWISTQLFGMHEWSLRLPSLVMGVGLVAAAYVLAYRLTSCRLAACFVAILVSVDHNALFYASEARPYASVQFVAAVQLLVFWQLQHGDTVGRRLAFVSLSVLLFYLHYTAILILGGEIVYWLLARCLQWRTRRPGTLLADLALIVVCVLPAGGHLFDIGSRSDAWALFVRQTSVWLPAEWFSLVSYVCIPLSLLLIWRLASRSWRSVFATQRLHAIVLVMCWFAVPLFIVWLTTISGLAPLYLPRYVIGIALAPLLLGGFCVAALPSRRGRMVMLAITLALTITASHVPQQIQLDGRLFGDRQEDWRGAVAALNAEGNDGLPVFVRGGFIEADRLAGDGDPLLRDYCLSPVNSLYRLNRDDSTMDSLPSTNGGRLGPASLSMLNRADGAWFLVNGGPRTQEAVRSHVLESLRASGARWRVNSSRAFGNVALWRVHREP